MYFAIKFEALSGSFFGNGDRKIMDVLLSE
jgi:hypothetical protein